MWNRSLSERTLNHGRQQLRLTRVYTEAPTHLNEPNRSLLPKIQWRRDLLPSLIRNQDLADMPSLRIFRSMFHDDANANVVLHRGIAKDN